MADEINQLKAELRRKQATIRRMRRREAETLDTLEVLASLWHAVEAAASVGQLPDRLLATFRRLEARRAALNAGPGEVHETGPQAATARRIAELCGWVPQLDSVLTDAEIAVARIVEDMACPICGDIGVGVVAERATHIVHPAKLSLCSVGNSADRTAGP